ncbi:ubiquitin carboxyl-terminal hydrolase CYLD [Chelonus insularis]|uniref:ubiquitin carboxyl-terminal hydrolase CYLD n=1 Tax=Chelonus insularis TaxID=460826 RepID=UPI0015889C62|nr:ubiquitin carboxyl-terminal hydrolase CYLD [Chelonus insularis]
MDKLQIADKMNSQALSCYYIAERNTLLSRISGECDSNIRKLQPGALVEAKEIQPDGRLRIKVCDPNNPDFWRKTEWKCARLDLISVPELVWHFLAAIPTARDRVSLANDTHFCEDVNNLKVNRKVWYCPDGSTQKYKAVIKYIGSVPEMGPGFYFGLDLIDRPEGIRTSLVAKKLVAGSSNSSILTTLNNIQILKTESSEIIGNASKHPQKDIEASWSKQLDGFVNSTINNQSINGKKTQDFSLPINKKQTPIPEDSNNNSNNNNSRADRESASSRLNDALIPKIVHQSTKSKILSSQDGTNLQKSMSNYDFLPIDDLLEKYDSNQMVRKDNGKPLHLGTEVEVLVGSEARHGIIRWVGNLPDLSPGRIMAAIELKDGQHPQGTDGTYNDIRYFHCKQNRAIFTDIRHCQQFDVMPSNDPLVKVNGEDLSKTENLVIPGMVRPICVEDGLEKICGKYRGIQGHHNSCYLDATLFSMFAFTSVFDNLLFRPQNEKDCSQYEEVQRVLREEIVNPLRKNIFVNANSVMKLRTLLEKLSSVSGLTSEEKDPEEFLTSLVAQILNAEPFLKLSSGQDAYHYQLFVEKDDHLSLPTVQQLLEQSFLTSNIRLKEVPSCFIIQMPRFGKSFKMYSKIQPTLLLDVTDIIEDSPRQCTVCGKLAEYECKECYGQCGVGLESIAFCAPCLEKAHRHERRTNHEPRKLIVPAEFIAIQEHCSVPRLYLELSAVVCIETSHYVSFVKCGSGSEAPWCFFDSMADRKGEQNGYNIPEMVPCPNFPYWLSEEGANYLSELTDDRQLPEHAKRLLCDAYMCMYQSPDVMMYK